MAVRDGRCCFCDRCEVALRLSVSWLQTRISYVYATPLLRRRASGELEPVDLLDVAQERRRLKEVVSRSRCSVRWSETVATAESMWRVRGRSVQTWTRERRSRSCVPFAGIVHAQVLLNRCCVLHFTGHGIRDAEGQVCLEDDVGIIKLLHRDELKRLLSTVC